MKYVPFNTNFRVFVKLNEQGRQTYIDYYTSDYQGFQLYSKENLPQAIEDCKINLQNITNSFGYTQFQLHVLMDIFGNDQKGFNSNIVIEFPDNAEFLDAIPTN